MGARRKAGRVRVKRECYSLSRWKGQTEETLRIGGGDRTKLLWVFAASGSDFSDSVRDPRRLVPLSAIRHRREVRRIGLDQETIPGHHPNEIVVSPVLERNYAGERNVPPRSDREFRQGLRTRVAVQDSDDSRKTCLADCDSRIVLGVSSVDYHRTLHLVGERDLRRESSTLRIAGRIGVVVVETAFTHRYGAPLEEIPQLWYVAPGVERRGVVGVNAGGRKNEARVFRGALSGDRRGSDGFADADDGHRARIAGAGDYRVAVAGERCVREVGVAVDEACRAPVLRGHLRSIQRRTGAAT